jgi:hypothetical protein
MSRNNRDEDNPELYGTRTPLVVQTQRAAACLGLLASQTRLETNRRIAHTSSAYVLTGGCSRPLAGLITHQQSSSALSRLSTVSSPPRETRPASAWRSSTRSAEFNTKHYKIFASPLA